MKSIKEVLSPKLPKMMTLEEYAKTVPRGGLLSKKLQGKVGKADGAAVVDLQAIRKQVLGR